MRDARRTTFGISLLALLLCGPALDAQTYPNGLSTDSVDPRTDAVVIRQIRRRLDDVRAREKRPTVGLVLSGGGAKGAAEVGAIRYIEELGIPIDFVCGTSIGGLVGGLYAMGYQSDDIRELFLTQDWSKMLSDKLDGSYISYTDKMDKATYLLSIPFNTLGERPRRSRRADFEENSGRSTLIRSLPSGYAYGFNVNNLISSLSVGYQDSISFSKLPIPFICVAGDMVSSAAKNWGSGSITSAMRSTMSIPGLFDPVRTDGMVLVDGGVRNNFPTDIAKAVGADYLIGIELSDALPDYDEINNIGDILGQFITMLGKDSYNKNIGKSDVFIKPSLKEFNMLSFNREAVDSMLQRGYDAAVAQKEGLLAIRQRTGVKKGEPAHKAVDISKRPVRLSAIEYKGLDDAGALRMARLTGLDITRPLDKATIDDAMSLLQATGAFETVTYSLYGAEEPYRLVFHCTPAPRHSFGLGLRADTEEWAALLIKVGLGTHRLSGSKLDLTARIGQNLRGTMHYALDLGNLPTLNASVSVARYRGRLNNTGADQFRYDVAYWTHREDFYVSGLDWTRLDIRAGVSHKAYSLAPQTVFARQMEDSGSSLSSDYIGTWLQGNLYTLDNHYFPRKGVSLGWRADYDFLRPGDAAFSPILSADLDFRAAVPLAPRLTFVPDVRLRAIMHFGDTRQDGLIHTNFVGGALAGRYVEDQVPFFGLNHVFATGDYLIAAAAGLRFTPVDKLHFTGQAGFLFYDDTIGGLFSSLRPECLAFGAEAAYETLVGPLKFNFHWSNFQGWGAYLSLGFDF